MNKGIGMNTARRTNLPRLITGMLLLLLVAACGQEPTADERVERARDHQAEGEYRAAIIELRNALREQSDHATARLLLGQLYVEVEQMPSAEKELRRARELGAPVEELAVPLGIALIQSGKPDAVLEELDPDDSWAASVRAGVYGLRARAHISKGDASAASEALERADAAAAGNLQADIARVDLALAQHRADEAASHADTATGRHPESPAAWRAAARAATAEQEPDKAEAALSRAIDLAPQPARDRLMRARLRVNRGDIEGAREDLAALGDGVQGDPRVRFVKAMADWADEDYDSACDRLQKVVADTREFTDARYYHGACLYRSGELNQAEAHLNWVNQRTSDPRAAQLLTAIRLELDQLELARATIKPVLDQYPDDVAALALMSRIEMAAGNTTEAISHLQRMAELRPDDPSAQFELGRGLMRTGQLGAGQDALDEALELNPDDQRVGATSVIGHIRSGEYERALETAKRMADEQPEAPLPWTLQALAHLAQADSEKAREALGEAVERAPGDPAARHYLARLDSQAGDTDAARAHYKAVLEAHEGHSQTLVALAGLEARAGNTAQARDLLLRAHQADESALEPRVLLGRLRLAEGKPEEALDFLTGSDGSVPGHPAALELAGHIHLTLGQPAEAVEVFSRWVDQTPENPQAHLLLARAYVHAGNSDASVPELERVLELDPDNTQALSLLARSKRRGGENDEARALIERLPEDARDSPYVLRDRAILAQRADDTEQAVALYRQLLETEPTGSTAVEMARALSREGAGDDVISVLEEWTENHPDDTDSLLALGEYYGAMDREQDAIDAYRRVIEAEPDSVRGLNNLAWLLRERAPDEALTHAERAVELQPDNPAVRDTLGMVLLAQGQPEQAQEHLRRAVDSAPDSPTLRYHLARALAEAGQDDEARRHLERALASDQTFSAREDARALLSEIGG